VKTSGIDVINCIHFSTGLFVVIAFHFFWLCWICHGVWHRMGTCYLVI